MEVIDEKVGLRAGVDKNEVPTGFQWIVRRTVRDDEGRVVVDNMTVHVDLTVDELRAHISDKLTLRDADIAQDRAEKDALNADLAAERKKATDRQAALTSLKQQVEAALAE